MSKAEKFISDYTKNCSNEIGYCHNKTRNHNHVFYDWLSSDQARRAVEIAREEIYEWLRMNFCNYFDDTRETFDKCIKDLKQAMKDE